MHESRAGAGIIDRDLSGRWRRWQLRRWRGGNENPPVASPGTGLATVTVDTIANTMAVDVNFAGLIGNVTAAHIHCCMDAPGNAGVASPVPSFPGFPLGVTARGSPGTAEVTMSGPLVGFIFDF